MAVDETPPVTSLMKAFVDFMDEHNTAARVRASTQGGYQDKIVRKKRNRVDLSTAELAYAVRETEKGMLTQKDIALELRVKPAVIYRLRKKCKEEPGYLKDAEA